MSTPTNAPLRHRVASACSALLLVCALAAPAAAVQVELRLVVHDQPEVSVEKLDSRRPIVNPVSTSRGVEMKQIGVDLTCWARNVRLDGQPLFERYHEGRYIDRLSVARVELQPGEHKLWPGDHVFQVAGDGSLSSKDDQLLIDGAVVRIKCYPVTIQAYRAGAAEAHLPMSMRIAPVPSLTIRETANAAQHAANPAAGRPNNNQELLELLPVFEQFAPLTVWLPANQVGQGYLVHPVGLTFRVGPQGIEAGAGEGWQSPALAVSPQRIEIPLYQFSVSGSRGSEAAVPTVESLKFEKAGTQPTSWYPRREPYEFRVADFGPAIAVEGELKKYPLKAFRVELSDPTLKTQRGVAVELDTDHGLPGATLQARVRAVDAAPATLAGRKAKAGLQRIAKAEQLLGAARGEQGEPEQAVKVAREAIEAQTKALEAAANDADKSALTAALAATQKQLAAAEPLLAKAAARVAQSNTDVEAAKAAQPALEAAAKEATAQNPLAAAAVWAELEPVGGSGAHALAVVPVTPDKAATEKDATGKDATQKDPVNQDSGDKNAIELGTATGQIQLTLPADANGFYRLRLGVKTAQGSQLGCEHLIAISRPGQLGLGLFTQRGRDAFYRGEEFWIGLGSVAGEQPVAAGTPWQVDLLDAAGTRIPLAQQSTTKAIAGRETFIVRLDPATSLALAAGRYHVEARLGAAQALPLAIELVEPTPQTHFTNLLVGKYNALQEDYEAVLRGAQDAEELARGIASLGYNAFQGMSYDMQRIGRGDESLERLARRHPELGPWETHYTPSGRDRFMNAAVRQNLRFYENLFSYHDTALPREPHILDACERYTSLEVASMRHSPAFRGVGLYDEFYESSDTDTPQQVTALMYKSQEMAFRAKHPGLNSSEALRALERFAGRPAGQRQRSDLDKFLAWPEHWDSEWRDFSTRMGGAAKLVAPHSTNFTLLRYLGANGGNLQCNGTAPDVFKDLDLAACVMYKDGGVGDRPVFAPMQADAMRVRDDLPVWTQLHSFSAPGLYGQHLLRQAFFALSQKIEGLTYFTIQSDPKNPDYIDNRDTVQNIAQRLTTPYGDLLVQSQRGYKKVAVYFSRSADYLSGRKESKGPFQCEGLWVACMRAGFPADFLYDEQVVAGRALEYDVVFAPGFTFEEEASPETLAALQRVVDSGKMLVVERSSKLPIEGVVRLDSDLDEYDDKLGGAFPRYVDFESQMVWEQTETMTRRVRDLLVAHKVPPAAEHNLLVGPDWLRCRQAHFLVVTNFADTGFRGLHETLYQAPARAKLRFPERGSACYDMLEMRAVPIETVDDWTTLEADLRHMPGKIYAFLPAPIGRVALKAASQLQTGRPLGYQVAILDEAGQPLDAGVPLEISLTDARGRLLERVYRAATPTFAGVYAMPANAAPGSWTLRVRELISGAVAEATVEVTAGTLPTATVDTRSVWLHDAAQVRKVLEQPAEKLIVLDDEQSAAEPQAQRLRAALGKRGIKARVVRLSEVLRLPVEWTPTKPNLDGARLWRGDVVTPGLFVDAPLILLGTREDHRLIEALVRRDVLPEVPSDNFPGPGRALISWTRQAFSNEHDTVCILASDTAGLELGVDALANLDAVAGSDLPVEPARAKVTADDKAPLADGKSRPQQSSSLRAALSGEDMARTLEVDPASGRVLVGTYGYGHNLFCLAADGKLLWKQFLPDHNVYLARWCDDGKRVVAATGEGALLFLLDAADGRVLKKLAASEWPQYHNQEGAFNTELAVTINAPLRQILIRGLTGVLALDYEGNRQWFYDRARQVAAYPQESEQTQAAEFNTSLAIGDLALSPDGSQFLLGEYRLVGSTRQNRETLPIWQHVPCLISARTGELIWENTQEPGGQVSPTGWSVSWPAESPQPLVSNNSFTVSLTGEGKLGPLQAKPSGQLLASGGRLGTTPSEVSLTAADGTLVYRRRHAQPYVNGLNRLSADEKRLYRSAPDGGLVCLAIETGKTLWSQSAGLPSLVAPLADGIVTANTRGELARRDADGKIVWQTRLSEHHDVPEGSYAEYVRRAQLRDVDSTGQYYPVGQDQPGDYEKICRFGVEQLAGGDFDSLTAWHAAEGQTIDVATPGQGQSKQAVSLAVGQLITQRLTRRVIPSSTYLLEFYYRVADEDARLTAAAVFDAGPHESFTGSQFAGRAGEWTFGRLAVKTRGGTATLDVGFEAAGGHVAVSNVSLRPIRFPSPNLLANTELQAVEPTFVEDIRVQYERIPARLRDSLMSQNRVAAFKQGLTSMAITFTQEQAFLHNGRLDDVGPQWTYSPDGIGFSMALTQPAYVSHLVLYLNNATPDNVYSTISVLANDVKTKLPQSVELVRGNRRRFVVVHFPQPIFTDSIKLLPGKHPGRHECLTEVEVYGPLGGPDLAAKAFADDLLASPMFMGNASHVRSVPTPELVGEYQEAGRLQTQWPLYTGGLSATSGLMNYPNASGEIFSARFPAADAKEQRVQPGPTWKFGTLTPTTTPARYAGRLLVGSADYQLHAVSDAGRRLWAFQTGGRIHSSPLPQGDDVLFGSDDGKLYKVDVDSGTLVWEFATGDKVRSSPALADNRVFCASFDGHLYAVDAAGGQPLWKAAVAKYTRSSPVVHEGKVYLGDEAGQMWALDAATGNVAWQQPLTGFISTAAVVAPEGVAFASDSGQVALLGFDGAPRWNVALGARVTGQPLATQAQLLVPTETGLRVLRKADGVDDDRFKPPQLPGQVVSVLPYGKWLGLLCSKAESYRQDSRTYVRYEGHLVVLAPKAAPQENK